MDRVNACVNCVKVFTTLEGKLVKMCGGDFDFPYKVALSYDGYFILILHIYLNTGITFDPKRSPRHSFEDFGSEVKQFDHR